MRREQRPSVPRFAASVLVFTKRKKEPERYILQMFVKHKPWRPMRINGSFDTIIGSRTNNLFQEVSKLSRRFFFDTLKVSISNRELFFDTSVAPWLLTHYQFFSWDIVSCHEIGWPLTKRLCVRRGNRITSAGPSCCKETKILINHNASPGNRSVCPPEEDSILPGRLKNLSSRLTEAQ